MFSTTQRSAAKGTWEAKRANPHQADLIIIIFFLSLCFLSLTSAPLLLPAMEKVTPVQDHVHFPPGDGTQLWKAAAPLQMSSLHSNYIHPAVPFQKKKKTMT